MPLTTQIAGFFYAAFVLSAAAAPFCPMPLLWRSLAVAAASLVTGKLIEGPVHWSDQNFAHAIGMAMFAVFVVVAGIATVARVAYWLVRQGVSDPPPDEAYPFLRWLDPLLLVLVGGAGGLATAILAARVLDHGFGGATLDLFVGVGTLVALLLVTVRRPRTRTLGAIGAFCVVLSSVAFAGSRQIDRITQSGVLLAGDRPWCLTSGPLHEPITSTEQLGFFSLPKGAGHHLVLLVRHGSELQMAHWSIRQQRFVEGVGFAPSTCAPRVDYAAALHTGRVNPTVFAVGSSLYAVPNDLGPIASVDGLSVRNRDALARTSFGKLPYGRTKMRLTDKQPYVPDQAQPLDAIAQLSVVERNKIGPGRRVTFAGTDRSGRRFVVLECLRGAYGDRMCHADVRVGLTTYSFFLPVSDIGEWSDETDRVLAQFEGFLVRQEAAPDEASRR